MTHRKASSGRTATLLDRAIGWLIILGNIATLSLVVTTVVAVFFRYVINDPIFGVNDVSRMTLLVIVACSIAYGGREGAHVSVDVVNMMFGRGLTRWTDLIVRALGILIIGLAIYALLKQGSCGVPCGHFTPNLEIPFWPFYILLAVGLALYGLILLGELIAGLRHFSASADPNEKG
jgi:TRAP-type C4-dicarboxylate transport system permease small subunit